MEQQFTCRPEYLEEFPNLEEAVAAEDPRFAGYPTHPRWTQMWVAPLPTGNVCRYRNHRFITAGEILWPVTVKNRSTGKSDTVLRGHYLEMCADLRCCAKRVMG